MCVLSYSMGKEQAEFLNQDNEYNYKPQNTKN